MTSVINLWPQVKPRTGEAPRLPVHQLTVNVPAPEKYAFVPPGHSDLHALICHAESMAHARGLEKVRDALLDALLTLEDM